MLLKMLLNESLKYNLTLIKGWILDQIKSNQIKSSCLKKFSKSLSALKRGEGVRKRVDIFEKLVNRNATKVTKDLSPGYETCLVDFMI